MKRLAFVLALWAAGLAPLAAAAATPAAVDLPPPHPVCAVTDRYWGVAIEDPYRCLEATHEPAVQAYMKAQADAAQRVLGTIPGRDRLLARIQHIDAEVPATVADVGRDRQGRFFYLKRLASDNQFKLYRRDGVDGAEQLLVDPEALARQTGQPHAIGEQAASPDGRWLAYTVSAGGAEIGSLHVIDTASRAERMPALDRIRGAGLSWLPDSSGFFYSRLAEGWQNRPRAERFLDNTVYLRRLAEPTQDVPVFGPTVQPALGLARSDSAALVLLEDEPLALAIVYHGVARYRSLYTSDKAALLAGKPVWRKVFDASAQVSGISAAKGWLYLRSAQAAPRFQVLRLRLPAANIAEAETVVPAGEGVVTEIAAAPEGLYFTRRDGVVKKLFRLPHGAGRDAPAQPIRLPFEGNVSLLDPDPQLPGVLLSLSGWTRAPRHYLLGPEDAAPQVLPLVPTGPFDVLDGVVAREVTVRSHDGVAVPVSILARSDLRLDGRNPALLYGYGAYGNVEEPAISARTLAWLEQGGVFVICHARGGGIYGDEWHQAGHKTRKFNTWRDGIATAEWLIAKGYTSASRLAIYGGSAGGIFVGRAVTERPDLFAAAGIGVGNLDQIRSETRANGAGNIPEYGSVRVEEEFHALRRNSTYEHIRADTTYPALLFEHGVNDTRVDVWMSTKTATRFRAANPKGKPVLMRLEYDAGHGVGSTRLQTQQRLADRWAFFLWQAGVEGFQPQP